MTETLPLAPMLRKLNVRNSLSDEDCAALLNLPYRLQSVPAHGYVVRDGTVATHSCLLRSGFAFREKITGNGGRQICSIHLSGDMVDLQNSLLRIADHSVKALTDIEVAFIPREAILDLAFSHRAVGEALWYDTLVEGSIFREWTANIGQRDARTRLAHLLCEFACRFQHAGLGGPDRYELPMSQEHLGDCTGLTAVHVNRMLKTLKEDGLLTMTKRSVRITDWAGLARAGDFHRLYLHLPEDQRAALAGS